MLEDNKTISINTCIINDYYLIADKIIDLIKNKYNFTENDTGNLKDLKNDILVELNQNLNNNSINSILYNNFSI